MNILMVSYNPYGIMGTSGTYNLSEAFAKQSKFTLLCNLPSNNLKVCEKSKNFPIIEREHKEFYNTICKIIKDKNIKIIIFAASTLFSRLIPKIKKHFRNVKCVVDFKSPRLSDPHKNTDFVKRAKKIQHLIDLVITPSYNNIETWIENYKGKHFIYDLGINIEDFTNVNFKDKNNCKKFVYIGQLHSKRKILELMNYINDLPKKVKNDCIFDFYGGGDLTKDVKRFSKNRSFINFKGVLPQKELSRKLSKYDVGLSWIPLDLYTTSPSLKFIEYIAAGLYPIATNTKIHRSYLSEYELKIFYDKETFIKTIEHLYYNGIEKEKLIKNYDNIKKFNYSIVCQNILGEFKKKWK